VRAHAVIPARYDSTRFPGKPLALLGGRSMVEWVYEAAASCRHFERVVVATDSDEIAACVHGFGGEVEMTRSDHATGTDRVAEVAERVPEADVIANVQGDQPFVTARMLEQLLEPYLVGDIPEMTTLACPLDPRAAHDPNLVKVVCDRAGRALYFSRAPIPHGVDGTAPFLHHLGLYAFRAEFLRVYSTLAETQLERCERLEQLRALEHGYRIIVCRTEHAVLEVNTPEDLERAQTLVAARRAT
jgi:3-deoxy-manno-octulosonate cytidylyltransferase (CMP-KDO synthetase)